MLAKPLMTFSTVAAWLVGLALVVAAAALLQFEPPRTVRLPWGAALPESCGAQRTFGIDCPGCGLTRSFILSAHGRWREAFGMHPAGTVAFAFLLLLIPLRLWQGYRVVIAKPTVSTIVPELVVLMALLGVSCLWWAAKHASALLGSGG